MTEYSIFNSLPEMINHADGPALLIYRGIPGSGKSTQAIFLHEHLGDRKSLLLDPDMLDESAEQYLNFVSAMESSDPKAPRKVFPYRFLLKQALEGLLSKKIVIWNQPFSYLDDLDYTVKKLREDVNGEFKVLIIEVETPVEVARERNRKRIAKGGHGPDNNKFDEYIKRYVKADTSFHETIAIDGTCEPGESVIQVLKSII